MATTDNLQKISETVWDLPPSEKCFWIFKPREPTLHASESDAGHIALQKHFVRKISVVIQSFVLSALDRKFR